MIISLLIGPIIGALLLLAWGWANTPSLVIPTPKPLPTELPNNEIPIVFNLKNSSTKWALVDTIQKLLTDQKLPRSTVTIVISDSISINGVTGEFSEEGIDLKTFFMGLTEYRSSNGIIPANEKDVKRVATIRLALGAIPTKEGELCDYIPYGKTQQETVPCWVIANINALHEFAHLVLLA